MNRTVMVLERSSENLQKMSKNGKTVLEGVFADIGRENRNGRIYTEQVYLPHLEYLKKDIANGNLLGELDHPEKFEVSLQNVSHRIIELWYDQNKRQILGRIEILDGTPKGQIAKALLDAGVPLSISSRAAGSVNEDKTVEIQQIYTYDLVAKPGFENAQLQVVSEGVKSNIKDLITKLNESQISFQKNDTKSKYGILNENVTIVELNNKYPIKIREEALALNKNKNNDINMSKENNMSEEHTQQWTIYFKNQLSGLTDRLDKIESAILEGKTSSTNSDELKVIKEYVEKLRGIQENALNWQSEIAKGLNEVASTTDDLIKSNNRYKKLTQKVIETVNYNAKTLNHTQDWISENSKVINAIGETVDHNAKMLNGMNEWNEQIAKGVNGLNEWMEENAKATNDMHEWTSSIAKTINKFGNHTEDMFETTISKQEAKAIVEYVEALSEANANPEMKQKINEMLNSNNVTRKALKESFTKSLEVLDKPSSIKVKKNDDASDKGETIYLDPKTKTIVIKSKSGNKPKNVMPKKLKTNLVGDNDSAAKVTTGSKPKGIVVLDATKPISVAKPTEKNVVKEKTQNLKLDVKPEGKQIKENLNRANDIKTKGANLENKLSAIIEDLEKQKALEESVKHQFPFVKLLNESDTKRFVGLSASDKEKVASAISKVPTTDSQIITQLWENALTNVKVEEPLWLMSAPKKYKDIYLNAPKQLKESINAKAEFFNLETKYQIDNFWEVHSGLNKSANITLNESVIAKSGNKPEVVINEFVNEIGRLMTERYK